MLNQAIVPIRPEFISIVFADLPVVVVQTLAKYPEDVWVAGGAVRDALAGTGPAHDIDLFFAFLSTYEDAARDIRWAWPGAQSKLTSFALTINPPAGVDEPPIQLIRDFYADPGDCIRQFDFSVNQAAVWIAGDGTKCGVMTVEFSDDIIEKKLRYVRPPQPMPRREVYRMTQLLSRGYVIEEPELDCVLAPLIEHITEIPTEVIATKLENARRNSGYRGRAITNESEETFDLQIA